MWQRVIAAAVAQLFKGLDVESVKHFVDAGLDTLETRFISGEIDTVQETAIRGAIDFLRKLLVIDDLKYGLDKRP